MMENLFSVKDLVVFITGGDRNIGLAVARGFGAAGAKVIIGNTSCEKAIPVMEYLKKMGCDCLWVPLDVKDSGSVRRAFAAIKEKYGRLDVMFNNAGVRVNQTGLEHGEDEWDWIFDINVKGTMLCCQEAARMMKEQGGGKIINTSSISSVRGMKLRTSYCSTKGAVNAYTAAPAVEWAPYGIYVNAVAWGGVDIDNTPEEKMSEGMKSTLAMTPLGKLADENMLFGPVAFLASHASDGIMGQTIMVDGGWSITGKPEKR